MRDVVLINGLPGSGKSSLALPLAQHLDLPLLSKDGVKEALLGALNFDATELHAAEQSHRIGAAAGEVLWTVLTGCSHGAVIDNWLPSPRANVVRAGLRRAGADRFVEIWCECEPSEARRRYAERVRHPGHFDADVLAAEPDLWRSGAQPLGIGQVLRVSTHDTVDLAELAASIRTALRRVSDSL